MDAVRQSGEAFDGVDDHARGGVHQGRVLAGEIFAPCLYPPSLQGDNDAAVWAEIGRWAACPRIEKPEAVPPASAFLGEAWEQGRKRTHSNSPATPSILGGP
jgi:hypothetical protein